MLLPWCLGCLGLYLKGAPSARISSAKPRHYIHHRVQHLPDCHGGAGRWKALSAARSSTLRRFIYHRELCHALNRKKEEE